MVLVLVKATVSSDTANEIGYLSFSASGVNTLSPLDIHGVFLQVYANGAGGTIAGSELMTGLTSGVTTFKLKYRTANGHNTYFWNRYITAIPL
jgi:hypothetical protein